MEHEAPTLASHDARSQWQAAPTQSHVCSPNQRLPVRAAGGQPQRLPVPPHWHSQRQLVHHFTRWSGRLCQRQPEVVAGAGYLRPNLTSCRANAGAAHRISARIRVGALNCRQHELELTRGRLHPLVVPLPCCPPVIIQRRSGCWWSRPSTGIRCCHRAGTIAAVHPLQFHWQSRSAAALIPDVIAISESAALAAHAPQGASVQVDAQSPIASLLGRIFDYTGSNAKRHMHRQRPGSIMMPVANSWVAFAGKSESVMKLFSACQWNAQWQYELLFGPRPRSQQPPAVAAGQLFSPDQLVAIDRATSLQPPLPSPNTGTAVIVAAVLALAVAVIAVETAAATATIALTLTT